MFKTTAFFIALLTTLVVHAADSFTVNEEVLVKCQNYFYKAKIKSLSDNKVLKNTTELEFRDYDYNPFLEELKSNCGAQYPENLMKINLVNELVVAQKDLGGILSDEFFYAGEAVKIRVGDLIYVRTTDNLLLSAQVRELTSGGLVKASFPNNRWFNKAAFTYFPMTSIFLIMNRR